MSELIARVIAERTRGRRENLHGLVGGQHQSAVGSRHHSFSSKGKTNGNIQQDNEAARKDSSQNLRQREGMISSVLSQQKRSVEGKSAASASLAQNPKPISTIIFPLKALHARERLQEQSNTLARKLSLSGNPLLIELKSCELFIVKLQGDTKYQRRRRLLLHEGGGEKQPSTPKRGVKGLRPNLSDYYQPQQQQQESYFSTHYNNNRNIPTPPILLQHRNHASPNVIPEIYSIDYPSIRPAVAATPASQRNVTPVTHKLPLLYEINHRPSCGIGTGGENYPRKRSTSQTVGGGNEKLGDSHSFYSNQQGNLPDISKLKLIIAPIKRKVIQDKETPTPLSSANISVHTVSVEVAASQTLLKPAAEATDEVSTEAPTTTCSPGTSAIDRWKRKSNSLATNSSSSSLSECSTEVKQPVRRVPTVPSTEFQPWKAFNSTNDNYYSLLDITQLPRKDRAQELYGY